MKKISKKFQLFFSKNHFGVKSIFPVFSFGETKYYKNCYGGRSYAIESWNFQLFCFRSEIQQKSSRKIVWPLSCWFSMQNLVMWKLPIAWSHYKLHIRIILRTKALCFWKTIPTWVLVSSQNFHSHHNGSKFSKKKNSEQAPANLISIL